VAEKTNEEIIMETNTELQKVDVQISSFGSKESFEHIQRVASMFSKSDMVPKRYQNNVGNCIIALEMANRMSANILMVMQNLDVIQGKPGWSSKFLIATLNSCGKFSPLRYEEDEKDGGRTRAFAIDKATGDVLYGIWVSMNMAKAEGWIDKTGSKWKTMPELMRRYRAASFFTNQFAPEVSMGLSTIEEVIDITPPNTESDIQFEELSELFEIKKESLSGEELIHAERILKNKEEKSYKKLHTFLISK
jgi:hypothetical protein